MQIRCQADVEMFCNNVVADYQDGDIVEAVIGSEAVSLYVDGDDVRMSLCESLGVTKFGHVYAYLQAVCGRCCFDAQILGVLDGIEL